MFYEAVDLKVGESIMQKNSSHPLKLPCYFWESLKVTAADNEMRKGFYTPFRLKNKECGFLSVFYCPGRCFLLTFKTILLCFFFSLLSPKEHSFFYFKTSVFFYSYVDMDIFNNFGFYAAIQHFCRFLKL